MNTTQLRQIDFSETTYGVVKRVRVFDGWLNKIRASQGANTLSILDFGCGTGALVAVPLAVRGDHIHGVDFHEPSIVLARQRNAQRSNLSFGIETTAQLIERRMQYDVIICSEVLEHLYTPAETLQDFYKLLAPGGWLFITVPNGYGSYENLRRLEKRLNHFRPTAFLLDLARKFKVWLKRIKNAPKPATSDGANAEIGYLNSESGHVQFFRLDEIKNLFAESGFSLEITRGRTLLCGPYVDYLAILPLNHLFLKLNADIADHLPPRFAADWMFLLRKAE
jgi:2-polyprenyl-3-methyl-5-hydroxy-6-metoxy-1,4-benzoquinol methylase